jgi:hypothetical protein
LARSVLNITTRVMIRGAEVALNGMRNGMASMPVIRRSRKERFV